MRFRFFIENLDIIADSDVDLIQKEGFNFFNVTGVHVKFSIGGLKLNMGNLFDGHRLLGKHPAASTKPRDVAPVLFQRHPPTHI